ncbi:DNA-binding FadR family transcriptional regulator [Mycolicibacterium sp. BK634]|uniref:FadR/GntR family transcriptional regulator n=1 Tax=Mycobacteriaceae TaxID=1762 RepID=UPI0010623154|nr:MULTISPECIES: FCD domain-containing protein [Mycobacteriaceae]MBB3752783.1 DNA-binding FadR family transcriptional regulator [Mycolicibacterium sp. BK634]TDO17280.1 GntR family transcriptional regulator [Mycobacterium sp. BK086]
MPAGKPKQVADELRGLIIAGDLDEGDLLGTEAELIERFDVSRPSLRESLRILEAEGLISVVRGAQGGVVVHRPDQRMTARAAALVLQSRSVSLADVFEASAVIEPAATRMVAASRDHQRAAEQLHELVLEMKRTVDDPVACTSVMVRFHSDIVQLAGNQTLILICEMINEVIVRAVADALIISQDEPAASRRRTIRSFEQLVALIAAGDPEGAQEHCAAHMARLRTTLLGDFAASVVDRAAHF